VKRKKVVRMSKTEFSNLKQHRKTITLECATGCGRQVEVDPDAISGICHVCTLNMAPLIKKVDQPKPTGFSQGWKLRKVFVHGDGRVFNQGIEQPELKGTLPSTDLKALKEKRVVNKKIREERKARRESRLVRQFEKKVEARKKLKKEKEQLEN